MDGEEEEEEEEEGERDTNGEDHARGDGPMDTALSSSSSTCTRLQRPLCRRWPLPLPLPPQPPLPWRDALSTAADTAHGSSCIAVHGTEFAVDALPKSARASPSFRRYGRCAMSAAAVAAIGVLLLVGVVVTASPSRALAASRCMRCADDKHGAMRAWPGSGACCGSRDRRWQSLQSASASALHSRRAGSASICAGATDAGGAQIRTAWPTTEYPAAPVWRPHTTIGAVEPDGR